MTAILILPQRQTVLVAKQAAELAVLSGNRLRLGIGTGWNAVEYVALDESFHQPGQRRPSRSSCSASCGPRTWSTSTATSTRSS